ncbi:hypothetical protein Bca52824_083446 [Brassica carinata]|uniref:Uncharacterized protein n=1 Tax=Brassica carinata TaxID=52824 RepID=A0A8X7PKT4_BRACI|nr:hypothetical protein Bca52824_083446 [Brassica carinata]
MYRASVVSVFPCEKGCCVDELWRLDNALRSRSGKTEQRHRVHFTFKRSHWSMHSTWKLWAQEQNDKTCLSRSQVKSRMDEPIDKIKHWGDLEEEEQEEEMDEEELEDGMESVDTFSRIAPGTVLGTTHTYVIKTGTQDKPGAKRVDLLMRGKRQIVWISVYSQKSWRSCMRRQEKRRGEKLRNKPEDFSDMVAEASLPSLLLFDKFHYIYVESRIGSQCLMDPITPCT